MNDAANTKKARMDKLEEDSNGLQLIFLKTCQSNSVSELIFVVCNA